MDFQIRLRLRRRLITYCGQKPHKSKQGGDSLSEYKFVNQNRLCRLVELDGHSVEKIKIKTAVSVGGVDHSAEVTRWIGLHQVEIGPRLTSPDGADTGVKTKLVDLSEITDAGPKLGTSFVTLHHPESPPCEDDRRTNRKMLNRVIRQILPGLSLAESE